MSFHSELLAQTQEERATLISVPIIQSALGGRSPAKITSLFSDRLTTTCGTPSRC